MSANFYEAIASSSMDMIALLDTNFIYLACNKTYAEVVGYLPSRLIGKSAEEVFGKAFFRRVIYERAASCMRENKNTNFEDWFNFPIVGRRFMEINYYPYLRDDKVVGFIVNARNITKTKWLLDDLVRKQQELEEINKKLVQSVSDLILAKEVLLRSNESLEKFASVASHDLKSPLMTIRLYLQLLASNTAGKSSPEDQQMFTSAMQAVDHMNMLIKDLLAYSKVDHPDGFPLMNVDANQILQKALANLRQELDATHARILLDENTFPTVRGNPGLLVQLFQNLLSNAMKFLPEAKQPVIRVRCERQKDGQLLFKIRDNGIGITKRDIPRLFTPFTRLHSEGIYVGSGLGLAICKRIIDRHDSKIWIQSRKNSGTTIFFTLPTQPTSSISATTAS